MNNRLQLELQDEEIKYANNLIAHYKEIFSNGNKTMKENILILQSLSSEYKFFNNNAIVFLTGSYARRSIKNNSDFDLNVVYLRGKGKKYLKYEELFFYIICNVFGVNRKFVHPVLITFNNINNSIEANKALNNLDFDIVLTSNTYHFEYVVPANSKKRMILQYTNNKNYQHVFNNLIKYANINGFREWLFNFLILNENKKFNKYLQHYYKKLIENDYEKKYKNLKDYIISLIKKDKNSTLCKLSCEIKRRYHCDQLQIIYNFLILKQLENKNTHINLDFELLCEDEKLKDIIKFYNKYIKLLNKLQAVLEASGFEYSLHSKQPIIYEKFSNIAKTIKKLDSLILKIKNYVVNELKLN